MVLNEDYFDFDAEVDNSEKLFSAIKILFFGWIKKTSVDDVPKEERESAYKQNYCAVQRLEEYKHFVIDRYVCENSDCNFTEEITTVCKQLKDKYGFFDWQFDIKDINDNDVVMVDMLFKYMLENNQENLLKIIIPNSISNKKEITEFLEYRGYRLLRKYTQVPKDETSQLWTHMLFAPVNQTNIAADVLRYKYVFHLSPKQNHSSIMTYGLVPKERKESNPLSNEITYPPRVYFFKGNVSEKFLKEYVQFLKTDSGIDDDYYIYKVRTDMLKDYPFYADPLIDKKYAVYTNRIVRTTAIENFQKI